MNEQNNTQEASATPAVEKAPKIEQNGVARPGAGTATARVWDIADAESAKIGAPVKRAVVLAIAEAEKINVTTAATQFGRWCKFHGIKAVPAAPKVKAEKKFKAPKVKAEEAAPAEAPVAE